MGRQPGCALFFFDAGFTGAEALCKASAHTAGESLGFIVLIHFPVAIVIDAITGAVVLRDGLTWRCRDQCAIHTEERLFHLALTESTTFDGTATTAIIASSHAGKVPLNFTTVGIICTYTVFASRIFRARPRSGGATIWRRSGATSTAVFITLLNTERIPVHLTAIGILLTNTGLTVTTITAGTRRLHAASIHFSQRTGLTEFRSEVFIDFTIAVIVNAVASGVAHAGCAGCAGVDDSAILTRPLTLRSARANATLGSTNVEILVGASTAILINAITVRIQLGDGSSRLTGVFRHAIHAGSPPRSDAHALSTAGLYWLIIFVRFPIAVIINAIANNICFRSHTCDTGIVQRAIDADNLSCRRAGTHRSAGGLFAHISFIRLTIAVLVDAITIIVDGGGRFERLAGIEHRSCHTGSDSLCDTYTFSALGHFRCVILINFSIAVVINAVAGAVILSRRSRNTGIHDFRVDACPRTGFGTSSNGST